MSDWPSFDVERDLPTFATLHLVSQMLGKLRLANAAWSNHGWHVALQPVAVGLALAPIASGDGRSFTLTLDLCAHAVTLRISDGAADQLEFADGSSIAHYHRALIEMLDRHALPSRFDGRPNEIPDAVRFANDKAFRAYNRDAADRLHAALALIVPIFDRFRASFIGKASPVHFFWGSFDLAVTRFSGREAPQHPGGVPGLPDRVTREAYSHEVSSAGFWAGGVTPTEPIFYSYTYPSPDGFSVASVEPEAASFNTELGEFVLPYAAVASAHDPGATLMTFLESTYAVAADRARWDRAALERLPVAP